MKLSSPKMLLLLLCCIMYFEKMTNFNNHFVDAKSLQDLSNKQLKIIQTTHGDMYECVDFYKQPSLGHLSTKNRSFYYEMRPKSSLRSLKTNNRKFGYLWKNGIGCPIGTIPIKKVAKEEMLRLDSFFRTYKPQGSWNFTYNQSIVGSYQHHFAVSRTKERQGKFYTGASMDLSNNDPKVTFPQFSSSRMHIQIGDDFIQVGWTVNPKLYSDSKTRTFVYTKAGEVHCFNNMCPGGFISIRSDFAFGVDLKPSILGSQIHREPYSVVKDVKNGNWYLTFRGEKIGYWPTNIFKQNVANKIEWGGEVNSASMSSPQMGSGVFPSSAPLYDASISKITTINEKLKIDDLVKDTEPFSDNTRGYNVLDYIYSLYGSEHRIYFGGPGNI